MTVEESSGASDGSIGLHDNLGFMKNEDKQQGDVKPRNENVAESIADKAKIFIDLWRASLSQGNSQKQVRESNKEIPEVQETKSAMELQTQQGNDWGPELNVIPQENEKPSELPDQIPKGMKPPAWQEKPLKEASDRGDFGPARPGTCPKGPNPLFKIAGVEIPIPSLSPSKVGQEVNAQWGARCNTVGPSYNDLIGTTDQNLMFVLIPILVVTALLLLAACAVCMILTRRRRTPPPSPSGAQSYSAPPAPTTLIVTHSAPQGQPGQMAFREMRPSYTTAPFGNVMASNVPYVVQTQQPVMQQSRQPSVMLAGPPMGGGPREGSVMYVRPPYNPGPRGYQYAIDRPNDYNRPLEIVRVKGEEEED